MNAVRPWLLILVCALLPATLASGQWQFSRLRPNPYHLGSSANGADGQQVVGFLHTSSGTPAERAVIWEGPAQPVRSLHPTGHYRSVLTAADNGVQVGWSVTPSLVIAAGIWNGTAGSWVNLSSGYWSGRANAVRDGQQGGYVQVGSTFHACIWFGSAASIVDLHPAGSFESVVVGVGGGQQVGYTRQSSSSSPQRAAMWSGSAASYVDLHPVGSSSSWAWSIFGGQQGGSFTLPGGTQHAALWTGSAESVVDLNPALATESVVTGMDVGVQVGHARVGGVWRAGIWNGTADSWFDLSSVLPSDYGDSFVNSVRIEGESVTVVGRAFHLSRGYSEAVMWTIPGPGAGASVLSLCMFASMRRGFRPRGR